MTKKHFKAIAEAMSDIRPENVPVMRNDRAQWAVTVYRMAELCQSDNPRFDRVRFYAACGYDPNEELR